MKNFKADKSPNKQLARKVAMSFYKGGSVLSLSADNFIFETELIEKYNVGEPVHCYEYDDVIYKDGKPTYQKLRKTYKNLKFKKDNVFNADASKYSFIFLDFCGSFHPSFIVDLVEFLSTFKGVCFITIMKAREKFDPTSFGAETLQEFRDETFPNIMKTYLNMDKLVAFDYQSKTEGSRGAPMRLYGFETI